MYGESSRPVYTKSRTTKRRDRFHGAFRGGFSAGHFNTVGSSKGWKPEYNDEEEQDQYDIGKKKKIKPSSKVLLDYMDEEDVNDWGGPSSLKQKFRTNHDSSLEVKDDVSHIQQLLHDKMKPNENESIGTRLLRALGWRKQNDGHVVYLPMEEEDDEWFQTDRTKEPIHKIANKKLKRVELKINEQMQKELPPPKIDVHGIGFNPFQNAPEFQKHKEMRRKRAQLRALAATSQGGDYRDNVYRTSALENLSKKKDERSSDHYFMKHKSVGEFNESQTNVLAYETADDFIGTKTVSGFALHDDDDDVYDDQFHEKDGNGSKSAYFNADEYNTEIYQDSDSGVETEDQQSDQGLKKNDIDTFGGALSSWASDTKTKAPTKTNDGLHVLQGFVMGSESFNLASRRWPGPDVPVGYVVQRHKHSNREDIERIKTLSRDMKSNMLSRRMQSKSKDDDKCATVRSSAPMAGNQFSSLANTLKSRFTTSTNNEVQSTITQKLNENTESKLSISRSWENWQPSHLLCKRFNVPVPRVIQAAHAPIPSTAETKEESFFKEHILSKVESLPPRENLDTNSLHAPIESEIDFERPTMEYMKSIFDTTLESDMSISDDDKSEERNTEEVSPEIPPFDNTCERIELELSEYEHLSKDKSKHLKTEIGDTLKDNTSEHKTTSRKRSRKKSYDSYSSSDDSDESRRRKHKKKHRRKHDSKRSYKKKHHKR